MNTLSDRAKPDGKIVHTILALGIVGLFALSSFAPYVLPIPQGQGGNLIVSFAEAIKNITILVVGYYFGSTATNAKRNDMMTEKALGPAAPPAPGTARLEAAADVDAEMSVTSKEDPADPVAPAAAPSAGPVIPASIP